MEFKNLSRNPDYLLHSWLPANFKYEKLVFFPDSSPGKSLIPTGVAALTFEEDWRKYTKSDIGCGMRLIKSQISSLDFTLSNWESLAELIKSKKTSASLGGGNHFIDALKPYNSSDVYFLIHCGARSDNDISSYIDHPVKYDLMFQGIVSDAQKNRSNLQDLIDEVYGRTELILDQPHNIYKKVRQGAIIRKGSVFAPEGALSIIPSHMCGDVALVRSTHKVKDILESISHGTGRAMSRRECKKLDFNCDTLRERILIPRMIQNSSLRTECPEAYHDLGSSLELLNGFIDVESRFSVIGYIGRL